MPLDRTCAAVEEQTISARAGVQETSGLLRYPTLRARRIRSERGASPLALALRLVTLVLLFAGALMLRPAQVFAAAPEQDVTDANVTVQKALSAARTGDLATAKLQYDAYENSWFDIEDGVRGKSRDAYRAIEKDMSDVSAAFANTPVDPAKVTAALADLDHEQQSFIQGQPVGGSTASVTGVSSAAPTGAKPTISTLLTLLSDTQGALAKKDYPTAAAQLKTFQTDWLDVEGDVKTRSADDYRNTENDMNLAFTLASQASPGTATVVSRMATRLQPYREASHYGVFDAAIILLREGLEALLVVVALLAFLKKSGNGTGQGWIATGAGAGLLASVVLGLAIQAFFGAIINPTNRELMEGVIGLVAAAMLIYVSYWLHSKASAGGWQRYLGQRTSEVIQGGRLFGLAALAFLAIFREGAETALFYLGMAGNISTGDLLIGLAIGFIALTILGVLMIVAGVRIPMRPFFAVASLLVFYLCFKFIGAGIHGLQVSGIVPAASASYLPAIDPLGMYPTWPTTIAQLLLLLAGAWVVLRDRLQPKRLATIEHPVADTGSSGLVQRQGN